MGRVQRALEGDANARPGYSYRVPILLGKRSARVRRPKKRSSLSRLQLLRSSSIQTVQAPLYQGAEGESRIWHLQPVQSCQPERRAKRPGQPTLWGVL